MTEFSRAELAHSQRWVIKVGSALLTDVHGLNASVLDSLCTQIAALHRRGKSVVVVTSGAIAEGCRRLGRIERPKVLHSLQAAASVGQMGLMFAYEHRFQQHGLLAGMVLLTHEDFADRLRYLNARTTIGTLLAERVIPLINENDTVSTEEIEFGDNDTLAARVASLMTADMFVILTDQAGLHEQDPAVYPTAPLVRMRPANDVDLDCMAGGSSGAFGRGGMVTKLDAARFAAKSGCCTIIADGRHSDTLTRIADGDEVGTLLTADVVPLVARKQWLAGQLQTRGSVVIDCGAAEALINRGVSLLSVGVTAVRGDFRRGDVVVVNGASGTQIARGLINYDSEDVATIKGLKSAEIEARLGYVAETVLIHRDNLVLLGQATSLAVG